MESKFKFFFKWAFVFGVLITWSFFVIAGAVNGSFSGDFNVPIYLDNSDSDTIDRISSDELINILFKHDFEIEERIDFVNSDSCSIRAKDGLLYLDEMMFSRNKLNFFIPLNNDGTGRGSLTSSSDRDRFSLNFEIKELTQSDDETIKFEAIGSGNLNEEDFEFNDLMVEFDKKNNLVSVESNDSLWSTNMEVYFTEGCLTGEKAFYLIVDNGELEERRSIEEVREILDDHPELSDSFEGLRRLYQDYWFLTVPGGFIS